MKRSRGFTFIELLVAFALASLSLWLLLELNGHLARSQSQSQKIVDNLEGAVRLLNQLEKDLAQMVTISGKPVLGYVLRLSKDGRSLVLRTGGKVVTYQCRSGESYELERLCEDNSMGVSGLTSLRFDCSALSKDQVLLRVRVLIGKRKRLPLERLFRIPIPFGLQGKGKPMAFGGSEL